MKNKWKKVLALVCCLALGVTALSAVGIPASAEGEYFQITADNRNLFVNVDQEIELVDVAVSVNGVSLSGSEVIWTTTDTDKVSIANGILKVNTAGTYTLSVEDGDGNTATVTVLAKNKDATEYVLLEEDFSSVANGSLPTGWSVAANKDVTDTTASQHATYVATPQVQNGVLYVGNGVKQADCYVLLPESLDKFGDYSVEMNFKQSYALNNMRYSDVVTRVQRNADGTIADGYRHLFRRSSSTANSGLELCTMSAGNSSKSGAPFNVGATRNWDNTTNWQADGYNMTMVATTSGTSLSFDLYRTYQQETFDGDLQSTGTCLKGEAGTTPAHSVNISAWTKQYATGGVALHTSGTQLAVDSIRVTVPAKILAGNPDNYVPSSELDAANASFTSQKIGVVSDTHFATYATGIDTNLKTMLTYYKEQGVSAVLNLGDTANTGLAEEYAKFMAVWNEVFPDPDTAPELLAITGNHEFEQAYYERETVQDVYNKYMAAYGYDTVNFHTEIGGIHIIGVNSETAAVKGGYSATTTEWLEEQLAAAKADDPYQPIIVMCHEYLPSGGTYSTIEDNSKADTLYDTLKNYPQVVYLSGHAHSPTEIETCIMQGDFTCIDCTSMQYVSLATGTPADAYDAQGALMLEVSGADKTMTVHRLRIDGSSVKEAKQPWVLTLPLSKKTFTYTSARADSAVAPTFAEGAAVTVSNVTTSSCTVTFPSATHEDFVQGYNVVVTEKGAPDSAILSKYFEADFYVDLNNMKASQKLDLNGLTPNTDFVVTVTAVETFGKESAPITGEGSTPAVTTASDGYARADFFDVDFSANSMADNSPYRRNFTLYGSSNASKLAWSDALNRYVLDVNGWVNYPTTTGSIRKIADTVTVEVAFCFPEAVGASQCLFGNSESGGISLETNSDGQLRFAANIGGWKYVYAPEILADKWYHVTATYDGSALKLYLNGVLCGETAVTGSISYNPDMNWMTVGANSNTSGNAAYKFIGQMALARIYTEALAADEVTDAYTYFENGDLYSEIWQAIRTLKDVNAEDYADELVAEIEAMIAEGTAMLNDVALTAAETDDFTAGAEALIKKLAESDPSIAWSLFTDPLDSLGLATEKSDYWQTENNKSVNKTLITKNANQDTYLVYKVDGYIRNFEVDVLEYAGFGKISRDVNFYISKDGVNWEEIAFTATESVADPAYGEGDAVAWMDTTASPASYIAGDYSYLKVEVPKFVTGINWSLALDAVRIWYSSDANDLDDYVDNNDNTGNSGNAGDNSGNAGNAGNAGSNGSANTDKPSSSSPVSGDNAVGAALALIALVGSATVLTLNVKKRKAC